MNVVKRVAALGIGRKLYPMNARPTQPVNCRAIQATK